jgi:hypothetical protein
MLAWLMRLIRGWFSGGGGTRGPFAGVRHPIVRRPSGNRTAAAVEEPDEDEALTLVGTRR